ncbi:MAG: molecular chaperone TorD family protein [Aquificaceae bacterium]
MDELKGVSFLYYAFSELFLMKDYYYLKLLCDNLSSSDYSHYTLNVLGHIDSDKVQEELNLLDEAFLLERSYRDVNVEQTLRFYEGSGFKLDEGYEPDHVGIELRFLSLLCLEGDQVKGYINQYRFIRNRLDWLRDMEETFKRRGFIAMKDSISFLRAFLRDHKTFLMGELKMKFTD